MERPRAVAYSGAPRQVFLERLARISLRSIRATCLEG